MPRLDACVFEAVLSDRQFVGMLGWYMSMGVRTKFKLCKVLFSKQILHTLVRVRLRA
jgi:hypothetical protein